MGGVAILDGYLHRAVAANNGQDAVGFFIGAAEAPDAQASDLHDCPTRPVVEGDVGDEVAEAVDVDDAAFDFAPDRVGGGTFSQTSSAKGGPNSSGGTPFDRCAAAGANTSRP